MTATGIGNTLKRKPDIIDAIVAGYLCVDMAPIFPAGDDASLARLLRPGALVETEGMTVSLGGVVANTGLALQRFGQQVALIALIGEDAFGDLVFHMLSKHGAALYLRRTALSHTATSIVLAPPGTDRVFLESPGCNRIFSSCDIDYDAVAQCRLFHFGYPTLMDRFFVDNGAELERMFARVKEAGVATSLDVTLPDPDGPAGKADWRAILKRVLPHVDIFVPSIEELLFMLKPADLASLRTAVGDEDMIAAVPDEWFEDMGREVLDFGVKVLLIKAAHRGAFVCTADADALESVGTLPFNSAWADRAFRIPAYPVDPTRMKNASGAGDAAVAGFLAAMQKGASPEQAAQLAMRAGRDNLYGADALSGLCDWETMLEELEDGDRRQADWGPTCRELQEQK